jgi:hypothetical protein
MDPEMSESRQGDDDSAHRRAGDSISHPGAVCQIIAAFDQ